MKRLLAIVLLLLFCSEARADQLAYLSKADAERAAAFIRKQRKIFLYCGCCNNEDRHKLRPEKVEVRYTGFEEFYEVVVTYTGARSATPESQAVDLAYTWVKKKFKFDTVGTMLGLAHDPCNPYRPK